MTKAHPLITPEQQESLNRLLSSGEPLTLILLDDPEVRVALPESLRPLLERIITELAKGRDVAVLAREAEMTTQEAADYLKVSRGYLVKAIDRGEIPSRMVGNQRRVKVNDVRLFEQSLNEKKTGRLVDPPVKMRDMSKDMKWLAEHREEYAGKWVAIYEGRLVAAADSAAEVYEAKEKTGFPQTLVTYIEEPLRPKDAE